MKIIVVNNCGNCSALHQNSEYPESYCAIEDRNFGMGFYKENDPAPSWCPLIKNSILIEKQC